MEKVKKGIARFERQFEASKFELGEAQEKCLALLATNKNLEQKHEVLTEQNRQLTQLVSELRQEIQNRDRIDLTQSIRNEDLEKENKGLCNLIKSLKDQNKALNNRVREYGLEPPTYKTDMQLICPSYRKSIESNSMLLKILDTTGALVAVMTHKVAKVTKACQTAHFKDVRQRIVYDYNFGTDLVEDFGCQSVATQ